MKKQQFFNCSSLEQLLTLAINSVGLSQENAAESQQTFMEELLLMMDYDFNQGLGLSCITQALAINLESLNPELLHWNRITENEMKVL